MIGVVEENGSVVRLTGADVVPEPDIVVVVDVVEVLVWVVEVLELVAVGLLDVFEDEEEVVEEVELEESVLEVDVELEVD